MMMKPASASGRAEGRTRSADKGAEPRGSNRSRRRSASPSRSRWRSFSSIVSPGTSSTPPTTTPARLAFGMGVHAVDDLSQSHDRT